MNSMQEMQKDLASIRIEIAKVQVKILTPQTVEKMIEEKCKLHQYHYHNKEAK